MKNKIWFFLGLAWAIGAQTIDARSAQASDANLFGLADLKKMPYIGGSLKYDASNSALSHLVSGVRIPLRVGKFSRSTIPSANLPDEIRAKAGTQAVYEYADDPTSANFGYITVNSVAVGSINVTCLLFNSTGGTLLNKTATINLGTSWDLNADGSPDLEFVQQVNTSRAIVATTRYLRFICSTTNLNNDMFYYDPQVFASQGLAGGVLGYNTDGFAVIRPTSTSALGKVAVTPGISMEVGDFVIDVDGGSYRKITTSLSGLAKTGANMSTIVSTSTATTEISDVLPVLTMSINESGTVPLKKTSADGLTGLEFATSQAQFAGFRQKYADKLEGHSIHFPVYDGGWTKSFKGGKAGFLSLKPQIGMDADINVSWTRVKANMSIMVLVDCDVGVEVTIPLAGKEEDVPLLTTDIFHKYFTIGPVLFRVGIDGTLGYKVAIPYVKEGSKMAARFCVAMGYSATIVGSWTSGVTASQDPFIGMVVLPQYDISMTGTATAYFMPYVRLTPKVDVYDIVYTQFPFTAAVGPRATMVVSSSTAGQKANLNTAFVLALTARAQGGAKLKLSAFGYSIYKEWQPLDVPIPAMNKEWLLWQRNVDIAAFFDPTGAAYYKDKQASDLIADNPASASYPAIKNLLLR